MGRKVTVGASMSVIWPISVGIRSTIESTVRGLLKLIRDGFQDESIIIDVIFVGDSELDLYPIRVSDEDEMKIMHYRKDRTLQRDCMEILFFQPTKPTQ